MGGGTPSIVPVTCIRKILDPVDISTVKEFTVEANPESLDDCWLEGMLDTGANRISIGVQSFDNVVLENLGRIHNNKNAVEAIKSARFVGFSKLSLDLMYGVPGQTLDIWRETLELSVELEPDHISAYSLGIEEDSQYFACAAAGGLELPDDAETVEMYEILVEILGEHGIERYEISNFARKGSECLHNLAYWNGTPYLGIGASAHSYDGTHREWNIKSPEAYCASIESSGSAVDGSEEIGESIRALEYIMLSLRTSKGLRIEDIGILNVSARDSINRLISYYRKNGFLCRNESGDTVLTEKGAMLADEIAGEIASYL